MKPGNNYSAVLSGSKIKTTLKSMLIGLAVGVVVVAYRLVLAAAEEQCFAIYGYLGNHLLLIPVAFAALAAVGWLIGILVSKYRMISGSGIPQVKGIIMGYFKHNWLATLVAKFLGGAMSILAGLSLGREGPSIQLGACVGEGMGEKMAATRTEKKVLIASGASAGLAAAFNAPMAGAVFALEEIFKYFSPVILLSTMMSAVAADFVSSVVFGTAPVFNFAISESIPLRGYWLLFIFGAALGIAGAIYNAGLLKAQRLFKKTKWLGVTIRPIVPALLAGVFGLIFPFVLGGGHIILGELQPSASISFLLLLLVAKFIFSIISFGSGAPGGIFFPLLVMAATIGAIFGSLAIQFAGFDSALYNNFIVLAMAGFFTAIVRAPITGMVLLVEMTGSFTSLLSLAVVTIAAYIMADLLKSTPIYESLLENLVVENSYKSGADLPQSQSRLQSQMHAQPDADDNFGHHKTTIETVVHYGSLAEQKTVKEIGLPGNCLLIAIRRGRKDIIPKGDTLIEAGDDLIMLVNADQEAGMREALSIITECQC